MRFSVLVLIGLLAAFPARSCGVALVLAVDVSGSVDTAEYRIQMDGLASALRDPVVAGSLIEARAKLTLVQWTGSSRQMVSVPWQHITDGASLAAFASAVSNAPRRWRHFSTAIGDALSFSVAQFDEVSDCRRRVVDVSGDGRSNEGRAPGALRAELSAKDITVNALVIEGAEEDLTAYFWENVIWGPGAFVVTASVFEDYPQRIREKLRREVAEALARAPIPPPSARRVAFE